MVQLSYLYMTTGKTITLILYTSVSKEMSLLFNMLSRFVIAFFTRNKHLLIFWLRSPSSVILEPKKEKCHCFHFFPLSLIHQVMGPDHKIFIFLMLNFKPGFSLSFFTLIKRLFSSSSTFCHYGGIICISEIIDISRPPVFPACNLSSLAFRLMYSANS